MRLSHQRNFHAVDWRCVRKNGWIDSDANLSDADLRFAKNLTSEQVKEAKNWEKAKYHEEFRKLLGLPSEPSK